MLKQKADDKNKTYRISIIEDHTHRKIRSYKFTKPILIVTVVTAVVMVSLVAYALIAFTPLKTTIPGYPDGHFRRDAVSNAIKIDSLESIISRWQLYADNLSKVLSGEEVLDREKVKQGDIDRYLTDKSREELARRDSTLRNLVKQEEQFGLSDESERKLPITGMHFFTPAKGVISNGFVLATHPGIDITAPAGTTICTVLDGTVIFSGWDDQVGYVIYVQHRGDIVSAYKHCQRLLVQTGGKVTAGTPIALLGNTGSLTTGDHLHFELWSEGEAVDPTQFISF